MYLHFRQRTRFTWFCPKKAILAQNPLCPDFRTFGWKFLFPEILPVSNQVLQPTCVSLCTHKAQLRSPKNYKISFRDIFISILNCYCVWERSRISEWLLSENEDIRISVGVEQKPKPKLWAITKIDSCSAGRIFFHFHLSLFDVEEAYILPAFFPKVVAGMPVFPVSWSSRNQFWLLLKVSV